jgi:hypothetical protein
MPRVAVAPQPELEPMDIHEMVVEQERAAELERAAEQEEEVDE